LAASLPVSLTCHLRAARGLGLVSLVSECALPDIEVRETFVISPAPCAALGLSVM
jgi:hypothetical protein